MTGGAKAVALRYLDAINNHDVGAVAATIAPGLVDHDPLGPGLPPGADGEAAAVTVIFAGFPDVHAVAEDVLAEGDRVMSRITWTGTHTGAFLGLPPTGKQVNFSEIHVQRVANGKIVEHWGVADLVTMFGQLGVAPPQP